MRSGCFLPLLSLALILGGGQSLYTGLSNREPVEVTIESVIAKKPDAKWLKINGGVLDVINASYTSSFGVGEAKSIHIPLITQDGDSTEGRIHVLVETNDAKLIELVRKCQKLNESANAEKDALALLVENRKYLRPQRAVSGVVKTGMEHGKTERKILESYDNLAPDAILLKEGQVPEPVLGFVMFVAGLVLGALLLFGGSKKGASPPPLPPGGSPLPPPLGGSATPPPLT